MPNEVGMDADQVRAIAAKLVHEADRLGTISATIDRIVADLPRIWMGHDAATFESWWRQQHKPALSHVQASVAGLAHSAKNNADDQDRTSGSPGLHSGSSNHGAPAPVVPVQAPHPGVSSHGFSEADFHGGEKEFLAAWHNKGNGSDQWNFGYADSKQPGTGDCTSFVAWRLNQLAHAKGLDWSFSNNAVTGESAPLPGSVLGNAYQWGSHAAAAGFPPDNHPAPGAVAWYGQGSHYSPEYGHVAIVRSVESNGTITLEESNYDGKAYDTRTVAPGDPNYPNGFIHFLPGS